MTMTAFSKKKGPKFARCNQCKLVFKKRTTCAEHAGLTGHTHQPCYWCTVCGQTFVQRQERLRHSKASGHVQKMPTTFATVHAPGTVAVTHASTTSLLSDLPAGGAPSGSGNIAPDPDAGALKPSNNQCTDSEPLQLRSTTTLPSVSPNIVWMSRRLRLTISLICV